MIYLLMGIDMNFNEYIIDESDYEFFGSLPKDEKILFMYDLICEDFYGAGSVDTEPLPLVSFKLGNFDTFLKDFESKLYQIVAATIRSDSEANILFINDRIIVNSESEDSLSDAVLDLMLDGYLLQEQQLTLHQMSIFHQQRYCKVFKILGTGNKISLN
jgi:hypothetical protein